jgi:hypothetical protein
VHKKNFGKSLKSESFRNSECKECTGGNTLLSVSQIQGESARSVPEVEWLQVHKISGGRVSILPGGKKDLLRGKKGRDLRDLSKPKLRRDSSIVHRKDYARSAEG